MIPQNQLEELNIRSIGDFESKLIEYIDKLQNLIKSNLLCADYYTWMLSFLNKLVGCISRDPVSLNEFEHMIDTEIISCSHFEMVVGYIREYFYLNKLAKSNKITIEEIEEISKPKSEFINLFRIKNDPTEANFIRHFSLHPNKCKFPFIDIFIKYHEKIQILNHLFPIITFTNTLLSKFSFKVSRKEASDIIYMKDLIHNDISLRRKFRDFKHAWKHLNIDLSYDEVKLPPISFTKNCTLNYFLVDSILMIKEFIWLLLCGTSVI